tara:strand:+ start:2781 stop:3815 length:1035 start_codon:yes stop_codon:yes gene_type:complete
MHNIYCAIFNRRARVKIAVLLGGTSMERDVSVASGTQVISALRSVGHNVLAVDSAQGVLNPSQEREFLVSGIDILPPSNLEDTGTCFLDMAEKIKIENPELVFLALHGGFGEDGTIQSILHRACLPYTGSNEQGSRNAMDKNIAKRMFFEAGIPTPKWLMAPISKRAVQEELGFPVIVKPNSQGSTLGLTLVENSTELELAIDVAKQFDCAVMVEQYISGQELTVGILNGKALAVGEIIPDQGEIFDYASKYQVGAAEEIFPAKVEQRIEEKIKRTALNAHQVLGLGSYSRVDFRMSEGGELWVLEVNTLPGLSSGSLLPKSAKAMGIEFSQLCEKICQGAIKP